MKYILIYEIRILKFAAEAADLHCSNRTSGSQGSLVRGPFSLVIDERTSVKAQPEFSVCYLGQEKYRKFVRSGNPVISSFH